MATESKYVVIDLDNGAAVGPFDSEEEAAAYFIEMARSEEWTEVVSLIDRTGSPFDPFDMMQLQIFTLSEPETRIRSKITY